MICRLNANIYKLLTQILLTFIICEILCVLLLMSANNFWISKILILMSMWFLMDAMADGLISFYSCFQRKTKILLCNIVVNEWIMFISKKEYAKLKFIYII